jgi:hypothetical protein
VLRWWGWRRVSYALDAFLEALQAFAQTFAQLRQTLRAKQQKRYDSQHNQMPWLK